MFGDVGQARTNAAMLLPMIATTSSRTCTKPNVVSCPSEALKIGERQCKLDLARIDFKILCLVVCLIAILILVPQA